jgi:uridylate kinase
MVTRLNARLLCSVLGDLSNPSPAGNIDEIIEVAKHHTIVVMGGTSPGHTTDAVAALIAEKVGALRVVNATSVDGIYSSDPKKDSSATRFDRLSFDELAGLTKDYSGFAGPNIVFDPLGVEILQRAKIPLLVVDGRDLEALENSIKGKTFHGTVVE